MTVVTRRRPTLVAGLVRASELTNHTFILPVLVFLPTGRCNSRCLSCDWWRSDGDDELTLDEIEALADGAAALGTQVVVFSGGEPLLRPDVFEAARLFQARGARLHLLTSGVLLERHAPEVATLFERVIVSLDAASETLYRTVRGVAALGIVERGVARMREIRRQTPMTARATLHRHNYRELPALIERARAMGLDGISFLPADVHSTAFGRAASDLPRDLGLSLEQVAEFAALVDETIASHADDFTAGFVAESADRLRRLPQYYAALLGRAPLPPVACNAPWMSVVVEANGAVRPCFFHDAIGNIRAAPIDRIVAENLPAFRHALDVARNAVCRRCVCSIRTGWWSGPWQ